MRDIVLLLGFFSMLVVGRVFRYPHVGVLLWCWTALVIPGFYSPYGFAAGIPYNKIVAIITLLAWLASSEPKALPPNATLFLLALFAIWGTISALTGVARSDVAINEWNTFIKIVIFAFVVAGLVTSKDRIFALLYAIVFSLGFHGMLSGAKYLASGGGNQVWGPGSSIIGDNNHFALGMVTLLPVLLYLYRQTVERVLKQMLLGTGLLVVVAIIGTSSRGGLIGLIAVASLAYLRRPNKMRNTLIAILLVGATLYMAPEHWFERMQTISDAEEDLSFMSRVVSWKQSLLLALDNPFFGGGFQATQDTEVWLRLAQHFNRLDFIPSELPNERYGFAAHSIYFQTLGDLGFFGLAIFLGILFSSWRNASVTMRLARGRPEWSWARDLAESLQYALFAYIVTGAALSMAYFDYMYMIFALLVVLRHLVSKGVASGKAITRA